MMKKYNRIVFVSMNNTCRGPMAELLMKTVTAHKDMEIVSRGLIVLFPEPFNPKAVAVLRQRGIILDNRNSVELTEEDITAETLLLALGVKEKEMIIETYDPDNLYTIPEFLGEAGEILDPYGKEIESYKECCQALEEWLRKVDAKLTKIEAEEDGDDSDRL